MPKPMMWFFERRKTAYQAFVEKQVGRPVGSLAKGDNSSKVSVGGDTRRAATRTNTTPMRFTLAETG